MLTRRRIIILLILSSTFLSSLGFANLYGAQPESQLSPVPTLQSAPAGVYFDHVVVIMMENEGIGNICGGNPPPCNGANTPYESTLANTYGIGQQYLALINTSWPDYYGILGASIFGCPTNCYPAPGSVTAPNLVDRFEAAGLSWKGYFENQNVAAGCDTGTQEPYTDIHNGFVLFQDVTTNAARCNNLVLANPTSCTITDCALVNDLNSGSAPNFMWLTPSDCNDMRGNSVCTNGCTSDGSTTCMKDGDNYLKSLVPSILGSAAFQTGRSALFLTFDEGVGYCPFNSSSENCVYAVWAGPVAKTGYFSPNLYNHYSLTKTIEVNWNLPTLTSNDASATAMSEFFTSSVQSPDFSVSASPASLATTRGSSTTSTITISSLNGFTGTVNLSATSSPSGPGLSLNPSSLTLSSGGSSTSSLTVSTQSTTPTGSYTLTVTGTSGSLVHSTSLSLIVSSSSDFSISASPTSLSVAQGSSTTSTITLTSLTGFTGTVTLSSATSPSGPAVSFSPTSITLSSGGTGSSVLTVSTQSSTPIGTYTITVTGTSGSLSHSTSISLTVSSVGDFSISANPSSLSMTQSSSAISTITLTSLQGFTGTITLSVTDTSPKLQTSLTSSSIILTSGGSGTTTLNAKTGHKIAPGTYTITITATSGSITHSITVTVTIT